MRLIERLLRTQSTIAKQWIQMNEIENTKRTQHVNSYANVDGGRIQ